MTVRRAAGGERIKMTIMMCVDDNGGTMFNGRRQSRDRVLREEVLARAAGRRLWMNAASAALFGPEAGDQIAVAEDFLTQAGSGEFCFAEGTALLPVEKEIEELVLFRWNRVYPADCFFDIPLGEHGWKLTETREFPGSSHERITEEVYRK